MAVGLSNGEPNLIRNLLSEGNVGRRRITLALSAAELANQLSLKPEEIDHAARSLETPFALRRRGIEGKIVVGDPKTEADKTLLRALASANAWVKDLRNGKPLTEIATASCHSESYVRTRSQLAFLPLEIQKDILAGTQPPELTLERIVRNPNPLDWDVQAKLYGFARR